MQGPNVPVRVTIPARAVVLGDDLAEEASNSDVEIDQGRANNLR
jgi:hypothetical protein